jgi:hypothetical protein
MNSESSAISCHGVLNFNLKLVFLTASTRINTTPFAGMSVAWRTCRDIAISTQMNRGTACWDFLAWPGDKPSVQPVILTQLVSWQ